MTGIPNRATAGAQQDNKRRGRTCTRRMRATTCIDRWWCLQHVEEQQRSPAERVILHCDISETSDGETRMLLILADEDMLQRARVLADRQPLFMDTTFAVVRYKLSFLTLLGEEGRGEPVCWAFLPDEQDSTITEASRIWRNAVIAEKPSWAPSCFLTDDCDAEQNAVRCAPSVPCRCLISGRNLSKMQHLAAG